VIRHLWKLVWNRKKHHLLIVFEIFISFLAVFSVVAMGGNYLHRYRTPLGFSYQNVWMVNVGINEALYAIGKMNSEKNDQLIGRMQRLAEGLDDLPEVTGAAMVSVPPYGIFNLECSYISGWTLVMYGYDEASDTLPKVADLQLVRGRWFGREDDGQNYDPVVVNRELAEKAFGSEDPIGKIIGSGMCPDTRTPKIVGVFTDYRVRGELTATRPFAIFRIKRNNPKPNSFPNTLLVRVHPGTSSAVEKNISDRLKSMEKEWFFYVLPLEGMRQDYMKKRILPLIYLGIGAFFMMLMVGSGLFGVLWMNVIRRTQEIGLRRAHGATALAIYLQLLAEMLLIATISIALGSLLLLPVIPILAFMSMLEIGAALSSIIISALLIYGIVALCALYPAYLAIRVHPAEALRYE
jgi:putative ABC transport system permease protein